MAKVQIKNANLKKSNSKLTVRLLLHYINASKCKVDFPWTVHRISVVIC